MKSIFDSQTLEINASGKDYEASLEGKNIIVQVLRVETGRFDLLIDGRRVTAYVSSTGAQRWVTVAGKTAVLTKTSGAKRGLRRESGPGLAAPMPGQVRAVAVQAGDLVKKGQTLMTVEAMKMEIRIQAPKDGRVKAVHAAQNQTVEREQILIEMED